MADEPELVYSCSLLDLPIELIVDIIDRLPLSSWFALASTCKHLAQIVRGRKYDNRVKFGIIQLLYSASDFAHIAQLLYLPNDAKHVVLKDWSLPLLSTNNKLGQLIWPPNHKLVQLVIAKNPEWAVDILASLNLTLEDVMHDNRQALQNCITNGHAHIMEFLFDHLHFLPKHLVNYGKSIRFLPFAVCAKHGHLCMVKLLHERIGLTIDHVRVNKNAALHASGVNGHLDILRYFIERVGLTFKDVANMGRANTMSHIVNSANFGVTYGAASHGHLDIVLYLLEKFRTDFDKYPLCRRECWILVINFCVANNDTEKLTTLAQHVQVFFPDDNAAKNSELESNDKLELLLEQVMNRVPLSNSEMKRIFDKAAKSGKLDVIKLFVERKGFDDLDLHLYNGWTIMLEAASNGHITTLEYLIHMANMEGTPESHRLWARAITFYVKSNDVNMLTYLYRHTCLTALDANDTAKENFWICVKFGYVATLKCLIDYFGLTVEAPDVAGAIKRCIGNAENLTDLECLNMICFLVEKFVVGRQYLPTCDMVNCDQKKALKLCVQNDNQKALHFFLNWFGNANFFLVDYVYKDLVPMATANMSDTLKQAFANYQNSVSRVDSSVRRHLRIRLF